MDRLRDVEDFPLQTRVITPSGRHGVVVAHKGTPSKHDAHERCIVRYTDAKGSGADPGTVEPLPHLLKMASEGPQLELF